MNLRVARMRAILGVVFALVGLIFAGYSIVRPGPNQNVNFGFAALLVVLGLVRVRMYLIALKRSREG